MKILNRYTLIVIMALVTCSCSKDKPNKVNPVDSYIEDEVRESEENATYEMVKKIKSHKTNRSYSDGFNSTPIYNDDNGRDYIIVRTPSSAKIVYLNNGQEVVLNQGVAILLDF